jgi:hypothetical protein
MSDPFERLASTADFGATPDVAAIRARARGIEHRRRLALSGTAVAVAVIAVAGIMLGTSPSESTRADLAQQQLQEPTPTAQARRSAPFAAVEDSESADAVGAGSATAGKSAPAAGPQQEAGVDTTAAAPARAEGSMQELKATLEVEDQTIGRGKTFTLKVCNQTSGTVTREFGSSQRYDFEVKRDGEVVWRWSDGMVFTQVVGEESWKGNECKTWTEEWDATTSEGAPVPTGEYSAVGILESSPELRTAAEKFSVAAI